jgi:hypothetical protein
MNTLIRLGRLAVLALLAAGCASRALPTDAEAEADGDGEEEVAPVELAIVASGDPLTNGPWDDLFDLTLLASPQSFVMTEVDVSVTSVESMPMMARCSLTDGNGNGLFDVGESVSCTERSVNTIGKAAVGQPLSVSLVEFQDGVLRRLANVSWTPDR